jgi:hypothetical protein
MSKGAWKRCPVTGESITQIDEVHLEDGSRFKVEEYPDCNLFGTRSIAREFGMLNVSNFKQRVLTDSSSPLHLHRILGVNGKVLTYCTHVSSAQAGGENYRGRALARMLAGKLTPPN